MEVVRTQTGYALVDTGKTMTDEVTMGYDKRARIELAVPEVSTRANDLEKRTIRKAVAYSK